MRAWPGHGLSGLVAASYAALPPFLAHPSPEVGAVSSLGLVAGPFLGDLPDIDQHIKFLPHRGPTHSLVVHAVLAHFCSWIVGNPWSVQGIAWQGAPELADMVFWVIFLPLATHPFADLINTTGVAMFWPIPELVVFVGKVLRAFGLRGLGRLLAQVGERFQLISGPFAPHGIHQTLSKPSFTDRWFCWLLGLGRVTATQYVNPREIAVEWLWVTMGILLVAFRLGLPVHVLSGLQTALATVGR